MEEYMIKAKPEDFIVIEEAGPELLSKDGEYLVFSLTKIRYSTENAVQQISKALGINRKQIGYAGSKDSQAITTQNITITGVQQEKVLNLNLKDIELKFIGIRKDPLSLGDLNFNRFEITIRNIHSLPKKVHSVINFFGEQRFSINNSDVGLAIIKKDFKKAAELICSSSDYDKELLESHLSENKNDYVGALKRIPWKTLNLYIHAYQSKLWNEAVVKYVKAVSLQKNESIPLVGFATEFENDELEEIYSSLLSNDGINQMDFVIRAIPDLTSAGSSREIYSDVHHLEIGHLEEDELNAGSKKCRVKFKLGKGSYATEVIKEMMN